MFSEAISEKLRPWQRQPAQHLLGLLQRGQNVVDMSDCGCGKTWVACSVAAALGGNVLAVVPKISVSAWHRVAETLGASLQAVGYEALRTGRTSFGRWENQPPRGHKAEETFICESCQCVVDFDDYRRCHCHSAGLHCIKIKRKPWKYGKFVWDNFSLIILDEGQRVSGFDSLSADLLIGARRQGKKILGLSATLATSPLGFRAWGFALGLFHNPDSAFYSWSRKHGCGKLAAMPGWRWLAGAERQREIMARISDEILPARGVRLTTDSIPNFPTRVVNVELFDAEKYETVDKLYAEMAETPERALENESNELPIVQQLRCRMRLENFKVPIAVELCADAQAKGQAVAIFCSFKATIAELRKRLDCDCVIDGSQSADERQRCIDDFQSDRQQIILVNSKAGGVACSLHDLCGRPRLGIVFPSFSAVEYLQVLGRLHRDGALSPAVYKVVLVAGTVEEQIKQALDKKLDNLAALNDFDLIPNEG